MTIIFTEYDNAGELVHVVSVETAEGPGAPPPIEEPLFEPDDPVERDAARADRAARRAQREVRIKEMILKAETKTRNELETRSKKAGQRLLVLEANSAMPEIGRDRVDPTTKRIVRKTDADYKAWRDKNQPTPAPPA